MTPHFGAALGPTPSNRGRRVVLAIKLFPFRLWRVCVCGTGPDDGRLSCLHTRPLRDGEDESAGVGVDDRTVDALSQVSK